MTYPLKFRQKVLDTRTREGLTIPQGSRRFDVGGASVVRWLKSPTPKATRNKPATKIDMEALAQDVRDDTEALIISAGHIAVLVLLTQVNRYNSLI